jgi:ubiquinone/menaquinone biosynthesis C-methylase UbiE
MLNRSLKGTLLTLRSIGTFWVAKQSLEHLKDIRVYELNVVLNMLPPEGRVLEIGAGTGWQARMLGERGYDVSAIDISSSIYKPDCVWSITEYDGKNIPFEDESFDIIYSSNTLEHIPDVYEFQKEIYRALKPEGVVVHVLPSSSWRLWSNITHLLKSWTIPKAHGEHASNSLTEVNYFRRRWWAKLFHETGWKIVAQRSNGLFYTGSSIMDSRINIKRRSELSHILGGAGNIFFLRKKIIPEICMSRL